MSEAGVPKPEEVNSVEAEPEFPLPPATFEFLVLSMKTQAEVALGLIRLSEEAPKPDMRVARYNIDLLAMIAEKTKGNLSLEEQRLIDNSLTELRFRYVQVAEEGKKQQ
jgi:hypothetical protein